MVGADPGRGRAAAEGRVSPLTSGEQRAFLEAVAEMLRVLEPLPEVPTTDVVETRNPPA